MPILDLTTREHVTSLKVPPEGQALYWARDMEGFGVRVTANGKKAYVVQARVNGASRRKVIGPCNLLPLSEARKRAQKLLTTLRVDGVDLSAQEREVRAAAKVKQITDEAQSWTLREVMEQYLHERRVNDRPLKDSTKRDTRRHVEKNFGDWADKPVAGITVTAVRERFTTLHARAPQQAKQAMGVLRALLNFARDEKADGDTYPILQINPVQAGLKRRLKPAEGRERMVPLDKVRATWQSLTKAREQAISDSPERTGLDMVAFGLLTGCRLGEAQNLTFDLMNLDEGWWQITADVAKDGKARTLPLCSAAVELLRAREQRPGNRYVFPSRTIAGREHFKDPRGALALVVKVAGLQLSFHDLRRTWIAVADECRIPEGAAELLTSHKPKTVTGRHYRKKYDVRHLAADAETVGAWITAVDA
jgi:integrase